MKKLALTASLRFDGANLIESMHSKPAAISYWGTIARNPAHFPSVTSHLFKVVDIDAADGEREHFIGCTAVEVGVAIMARDTHHCERVGRLIAGCGDDKDVDVLVQFATFGEVRYG